MSASRDDIHLSELTAGVLRTLPRLPIVFRGLWGLISLKRDDIASIGLQLERVAQKYPNRPALLFEDRRWTYAELNAWANRCAAAFRARGVGSGDRVAVLMENRAELMACVAGAVKLGAVAALINNNQRGAALGHSLKLTEPKLIVVSSDCTEALCETAYAPAAAGTATLWVGDGEAPAHCMTLQAATADQPEQNPPETQKVVARQPCFHIFTSGTTGMPKAAVMTHYRWLRGMSGIGQLGVRLSPEDVLYCALPLYHNNALTVSWGATLGSGAAFAMGKKFSASRFWDEIRHYGATSFCYIGELCRYLLNRPPSPSDRDHRVHTIVGNGLRPDLWDQFEQRFNIHNIAEFYGASENNLVFINGFGQRKTAGFCPLSFAIVDFDAEQERPCRGADGFMRKVARGGTGLLITEISDKSPFDGYTDKKASEAKVLRDVFAKGDAWFNTGDLVRDQGYRHIAFVDRIGDTFRWKGENVATTEVEAALSQCPNVEHAVVYGVQIPGTDGRAGMAAMSQPEATFDGAGLASALRERLPTYAIPLFIRLRAEQETTSTFKYSKVELKRQGFDPHQIHEPLYVLCDAARGYEPLTAELHARILSGAIRF